MLIFIFKKCRNIISFSNIGILFLFFLASSLLISCCKTCIFARNEITGFSTKENKLGSKVTTISAGDKSVKFSALDGGEILSYSVGGNNLIFHEYGSNNNCGGYSNYFINQKSDTPLQVIDSTFRTFKPDKIIITSRLNDNFSLNKVMKMNLDNGDVYILDKLVSMGDKQKEIHSKNVLNLKPGGFLIIPINSMSKFRGGFVTFNNSNEIIKTAKTNYFEKYNDLLLVNTNNDMSAVASDSNSGWFAYIRNDVLMIIKYPHFYNRNYPDDYTIKAKFKEKLNKLLLFNPNRTIGHNKALYIQYKLIVVKLDKSVNSFEKVKRALKSVSIPLLLRR